MKAFLISIVKDLFLDLLKSLYDWAKKKKEQRDRLKEAKDAIKDKDKQNTAKRINNIFRK